MKEERSVKSANERIPFKVANTNFLYSTFLDKGTFFTLIHKVEDDGEIHKNSSLLMQFEINDKTEYLNFRKSFGILIRNFIEENNNQKEKNQIENKFLEYAKSNISLSNKWYNPEFSYFVKDKNNIVHSQSDISDYKKCNEIKPVILLEILQSKGYISSVKVEHNTHGEEFWVYNLQSGKKLKTSVKTKEFLFKDQNNLYSPVNEIFNDVYESSKNYGKGAVGLVSFLGDKGLFDFPLPGPENKSKRDLRSINFILNNIYPFADPLYLANNHELSNQASNSLSGRISNYPIIPIKTNRNMDKIKNYMIDNRGLSKTLVNEIVEEGLLYGGNWVYNPMKDEKELKTYFNQYFFTLSDSKGNICGGERLTLFENKNSITGETEQKITKFNTHPVKGNGFRLMTKHSQPLGTFIGEAVIDVLSARQLFEIGGLEADRFNYISIQGCNNLNNFLGINAGFSIETNQDYRPHGEVYSVKHKVEKDKISQAKIENYNSLFKNYDFYFINTNNEACKEIMTQMPLANKVLGKEVKVIYKNSRSDDIAYSQYDKKRSVFFDETSFNSFFVQNSIDFQFDSETNKYKIMLVREKTEEKKLTPEIKNEIANKMINTFGTTTLLFCLDSDEAGLKYRNTLNNIGKNLGIEVYDMYPKTVPGKENKTDVNDVLRFHNKLKKEGELEKANKVVEDFIKGYIPNFTLKKNNNLTNKPH